MRLHREGTPTLLLAVAAGCFVLYGLWTWLPGAGAAAGTAAVLLVLGLLFWFFRVPFREVTRDGSSVLSPADGRVVVIEEVHEPEYFNAPRRQVSIFMSPLNVHVNWYPIGGEVLYARHHPGRYLVAWHPKSSMENERSTLVVRGARFDVLVRQIAGAVARRIRTYGRPGEDAIQGAEMGFIKFGSRLDVLLPLDAEVTVRLGQRVQGITTVIARCKP